MTPLARLRSAIAELKAALSFIGDRALKLDQSDTLSVMLMHLRGDLESLASELEGPDATKPDPEEFSHVETELLSGFPSAERAIVTHLVRMRDKRLGRPASTGASTADDFMAHVQREASSLKNWDELEKRAEARKKVYLSNAAAAAQSGGSAENIDRWHLRVSELDLVLTWITELGREPPEPPRG